MNLIFDRALADPWAVRDYAIAAEYRDVPLANGAVYPTIHFQVPADARREIAGLLQRLFGREHDVHESFFRLSLAGGAPPFYAHTDGHFGSTYTALLYLTPDPPAGAATRLLRHRGTGLRWQPSTERELATWRMDANAPLCWEVELEIPMRFNRLVVIPSRQMHAASPGFGSTPADGRLVLTTFFSPRSR